MVAALAPFADNAITASVLLNTQNVEMRVMMFSLAIAFTCRQAS
jgi:hypothetical protein